MITRDWRGLTPSDIAPWYAAETARWYSDLNWDTRETWSLVESARAAGTLPGLVAYEKGAPVGWAFYLLHQTTLQIGGVAAASDRGTGAILDAVLASPESALARSAMAFLPASVPDLERQLSAREFSVLRYRYMSRPLDSTLDGLVDGMARAAFDPFHVARLPAVANLLSRAYPGVDVSRPFAANGSTAEWFDYSAQLAATTACGALLPSCSVLAADRAGEALQGAVLATAVSSDTGHLAQVAVDPARQQRGLGRALVWTALGRLRAHGYAYATLLVSERNDGAGRLYERLGFAEKAKFVSGFRPQPRRSTMAACSTGGVSTLR